MSTLTILFEYGKTEKNAVFTLFDILKKQTKYFANYLYLLIYRCLPVRSSLNPFH